MCTTSALRADERVDVGVVDGQVSGHLRSLDAGDTAEQARSLATMSASVHEDQAMTLVARHLRGRRRSLLATYSVVAVENVLELLYPFATGRAVDDLLHHSARGVVLFASLWAAHSAITAAREWYSSRLFARVYADLATDLALESRRRGVDSSAIVAHSALAFELVQFFELNVGGMIAAAFAFVGSLIMITIYDVLLGAVALALAVPLIVMNRWMYRRSTGLVAKLNDEFEREADVLSGGSDTDIGRHYDLMARAQTRLGRTHTRTWASLEVFVVVLVIVAFVRATDITDQPGTIYAIIAYAFAYVGSFDHLPAVVQQLSGLRDIVRRFNQPIAARRPEES